MFILTDNGSLEPAAALALRALAAKVSSRIGEPVHPVSLLHSSTIPADRLDGVAAEILEPFLARRLAEGEASFKIVPLFFGPSLALTDYLPKRLDALAEKFPDLDVGLAAPLCDDLAGERLISWILERAVVKVLPDDERIRPAVILVDHGSPVPAVTEVRDRLADELSLRLGAKVTGVTAASMERREGAEYDFNEPLLATALRRLAADHSEIIVAMQFLLPGRHAGPGGDIAGIIDAFVAEHPGIRVSMTGLVAEDEALVDLLVSRFTL